jgi:dTDP-4-dehydrorhamnose reductase
MKIIGTGLNGLVGSRVVELLTDQYQFENISRQNGVDITNKAQIASTIAASDSEIVLHLAAFTDVDGAEKDKELGDKIIYFSTDMVFPGDKEAPERYSEEDQTGAVGFYAKTKEEAEKLIEKATCPWVILRIAYPYRANFEKKEYVRVFKSLLEEGKQIKAVSDHFFTPTFIDDIAPCIDLVIKGNLTGKYHVTGEETVSPYEAAIKIAEVFSLNQNLVEKTTRAEFFKDRAPRAYNLALNNDKITKLGIKLRGFKESLQEIKKQLSL